MRSLIYLTAKRMKNKLKDNIRHPGRIIFYFIFFAVILFNIFLSGGSYATRDRQELYALVFAFYAFNFVLTVYEGFSSGGMIFTMADVNLLFPLPNSPALLLLYGMLNRLGTSVVFGMAFIYEYPLIKQAYSLDFSGFMFLLFGFILTVFLSRILSMLLYFFTCGSENRKKATKAVLFVLLLMFFSAVVLGGGFIKERSLENLVKGANLPFLKLFPFCGVVLWAVQGLIEREFLPAVVCLAFSVAFVGLSFMALTKSKRGFYEDVMESAEKSYSAVTSNKEVAAQYNIRGKVKLGKTGFTKGFGASVIYQKHKIENRRTRKLTVSFSSLFSVVTVLIFSFTSRDMLSIFIVSIYSMIFSVLSARWTGELSRPYIYLIPEGPVKKLFYCLSEQVPSLIYESLLCFVPLIFIWRLSPVIALILTASRACFGFVMLGANLMTYRVFASREKGKLYMTVNLFIGMFFSLPGLLMIFIMQGEFFVPMALSFLFSMPVNILVAFFLLFLSRNLFIRSEI